MATASSELQLVISAKDEASKKIKAASSSVLDLSKAVVIGQVAYDAFKKVAGEAINLVKSSVNAYAEAEASNVKVNTILKTLNTSLDEQATLFAEVSKRAIRLGFDDESAAESMAKLWQVTGDVKIAQQALASAMDLARFKGMDLESATQAITLAYGGNTRMLKQLGIEIDDNASKTEILGAIQEKVAGQSEAFGETQKGAFEKMKVSIENAKEELGGAFAPIVTTVANLISDFVTSEQFTVWMEHLNDFISEKLIPIFGSVKEYLAKFYNKLEEFGVIQMFKDQWSEIINLFNNALLPTIEENKDIFIDLAKIIGVALVVALALFLEAIKLIIAIVTTTIDILGTFRDYFISLQTAAKDAITTIKNYFSSLPDTIRYFINLAISYINKFLSPIYTVINALSTLKSKLSSLGTTGKIPSFATGGIVTRPTLALVGEAGPEAIVPLNKQNGAAISVSFNNVNVRSENDLNTIVDTVKRTLSRDLIKQQLGT